MITQPVRKSARLAAALAIIAGVAACGSQPTHAPTRDSVPRPVEEVRVPQTLGARAAAIALQQVGVPYRYGGSTRSGFDCSGLVQYSYARAGKRVPRTTGQLWAASQTISEIDLQQGDLLFFNVDGKMSHVGLYVGQGEFVHAPSSGRTVSVERLDAPYYASALTRVARPR